MATKSNEDGPTRIDVEVQIEVVYNVSVSLTALSDSTLDDLKAIAMTTYRDQAKPAWRDQFADRSDISVWAGPVRVASVTSRIGS